MRRPSRLLILALCVGATLTTATQGATPYIPRYDHVVVVIMSAKSYSDIHGSSSAPYINGTLIQQGASFTSSYALSDLGQPNYIALFSGSAQGVTDDTCPYSFGTQSLGQQLINAGLSFTQYSEGLNPIDPTSCGSGLYTRRHNPVPDFPSPPVSGNRPYSEFAGVVTNATLPTISFVVPNLCNDMHGDFTSCAPALTNLVKLGDDWLQANIPQYLASSAGQNGLLIVTWDHGSGSAGYAATPIPTIFFGPHVRAGYTSSTLINHYNVLRTLEDMYGLTPLGGAASAAPITNVWDTIFRDGFE